MRIYSTLAVSALFFSLCTHDGTSFAPSNYIRLLTFLKSNEAEENEVQTDVDLKRSSSSYFVQTTSSLHHFQEGSMRTVPSRYLKEHEVEKSIELASERAAELATEKACEAAVEQACLYFDYDQINRHPTMKGA